jgi:hypothetical protein
MARKETIATPLMLMPQDMSCRRQRKLTNENEGLLVLVREIEGPLQERLANMMQLERTDVLIWE